MLYSGTDPKSASPRAACRATQCASQISPFLCAVRKSRHMHSNLCGTKVRYERIGLIFEAHECGLCMADYSQVDSVPGPGCEAVGVDGRVARLAEPRLLMHAI